MLTRLVLIAALPALTACSPEVMQVVGAVATEVLLADAKTGQTGSGGSSASPAPMPGPSATVAPSAAPVVASAEVQGVLTLVNAERAKTGARPMVLSGPLNDVAAFRSQDMAKRNYFDHVDPDGHDPFHWLDVNGIRYMTAGENIAMGQKDPADVMDSWMNSPGHRANILKTSFGKLGVGLAKDGEGQIYWTQIFTD